MNGILDGQIVVVTGAGRGWGHSICRMMAQHGATIVATSEVGPELVALQETVQAEGGGIEIDGLDLTGRAATGAFAAGVLDRHGRVDTLVNGAAILRNTNFLDLTQDQVEATIEVMLLAPMRLIRAFAPGMIEAGRGAIINISSRAGRVPFAGEAEYCAAKFGLEGFSYSIAEEFKPHNISVNLVTPGKDIGNRPIKPTSVTSEEFAAWPEEKRAQYRDSMELSEAFVYLALQDANSLTGRRFSASALSRTIREHGYELSKEILMGVPEE
ncbi:SDR family oxidoreductase [soil metagenome]